MKFSNRPEWKIRFYNSKEWRRLSYSFLSSRSWICENCGNKNVDYSRTLKQQIHAHHIIELTVQNYFNPDISLNEKNLRCLCIKCHNAIDLEPVIAYGLHFDGDGNVIKNL